MIKRKAVESIRLNGRLNDQNLAHATNMNINFPLHITSKKEERKHVYSQEEIRENGK